MKLSGVSESVVLNAVSRCEPLRRASHYLAWAWGLGPRRSRKSRKAFAFFVAFRVLRGPNAPGLVLDVCSPSWYTEFSVQRDKASSGQPAGQARRLTANKPGQGSGRGMKEKKQWVKPELVVLVQRKPEEGILTACQWSGTGSDSGAAVGACGGSPGDRGAVRASFCSPCSG